ncbi:hypothetical protein M9458_007504, partial [Cirrhinus mrigala]
LHSGFLTLPRLSRLDQSFAETSEFSLPENSEASLTRSDSLSSFTVDLGPSLMSEVLELIDSSCCLITSRQDEEIEEEERQSSVFETDNKCQTTDASVRHPIGADVAIEPRRPEEERQRPSSFRHIRTPYSFTETEEEIK